MHFKNLFFVSIFLEQNKIVLVQVCYEKQIFMWRIFLELKMQKTQLVDKTFNIQLSEKKRKSSLKWATVNAAFLSVIYYDISTTNKLALESELFYYVELAACAILSLSFATNILTFIYYTFFTDKVVCDSESQRFLLNLSNNSILKSPQPKIQAPTGNQNETINIRNLSYQTYSERKSTPRKQFRV